VPGRALFLDRDGTLIVDTGYLRDPESVVFLPHVFAALHRFQELGFLLITVSNQSGIGRNLITEQEYLAVQEAVAASLKQHGIHLTASYFCPHAPSDGCNCRKPSPGMLIQAARDWNISLQSSLMIGDKLSDIAAGQAAGCGTVLVNRKREAGDHLLLDIVPDLEIDNWSSLDSSKLPQILPSL
jgi:D-glycero-D-manno-heptose 1,7-bisphosphate phosphatase